MAALGLGGMELLDNWIRIVRAHPVLPRRRLSTLNDTCWVALNRNDFETLMQRQE